MSAPLHFSSKSSASEVFAFVHGEAMRQRKRIRKEIVDALDAWLEDRLPLPPLRSDFGRVAKRYEGKSPGEAFGVAIEIMEENQKEQLLDALREQLLGGLVQ